MSTETCEVPNVERKEYQLIDIDEDGYLALYDDGTPKRDLRIGTTGVDAELRAAFQEYVFPP
jgi:translation initiation factor 5A